MPKTRINLSYLGVARCRPNFEVIASCALVVGLRKNLLSVLVQAKIAVEPGRNYRISSPDGEWYLMVDNSGIVYFMLTKDDYPFRLRYKCLEELQSDVSSFYFLLL